MKKQLLRLLPVAAVLLTASCTDDQYDISNVDTESRFTAKGLVIPLNMSPIMLDNIISIEEDGDIQKDADGNYYFKKVGKEPFKSEDVKVEKITITKPSDISQNVSVTVTLPTAIQNNWNTYASGMTIKQIKDAGLSSTVGIDDDTEIFSVTINASSTTFNMNAENIDSKITIINKLGLDPLPMNLDIRLGALNNVVNKVNISNLNVALPSGMTIQEADVYNSNNGELKYNALEVSVGTPKTIATVTGLDCNAMGTNLFNKSTHKFTYSKECSISGTAKIKVSDLSDNTTLSDITAGATSCTCVVNFSNDLVINSFSGGIYHKVEGINIDPVEIKNLPEILQEEGTSIEIANPQLYLRVTNPDFNKENPAFSDEFKIEAGIRIEGNKFMPDAEKGKVLSLDKRSNYMVLSPEKDGLKYSSNYDWIEFSEMRELLTGKKIPEKLNINVVDPVLSDDKVTDFELGKTYQGITGEWEFYANLSLTGNTIIKYTKEWDDWGSDDLNGLTVENAVVTFNVKKDVALKANNIEFFLMGKDAKDGKTEKSLYGKTTLTEDEDVLDIPMTGSPIKNISGGRLVVNLKGEGKDINKNQKIEISNLRMKVDGYYDKEF